MAAQPPLTSMLRAIGVLAWVLVAELMVSFSFIYQSFMKVLCGSDTMFSAGDKILKIKPSPCLEDFII